MGKLFAEKGLCIIRYCDNKAIKNNFCKNHQLKEEEKCLYTFKYGIETLEDI